MDGEEIQRSVRVLLEQQERRFEAHLSEQRAEIEELRRTLEEVRASSSHDESVQAPRGDEPDGDSNGEPDRSRRQFLRAGALAAGAGLAGAGVAATPAAAANGDPWLLGNAANSASATTRLDSTASRAVQVRSNGGTNSTALRVEAEDSAAATNTFGVVALASGPDSTALWAFSPYVQLHLSPWGTAPPTRTIAHGRGDIQFDIDGDLWACVQSGTPGVWRKVAGASTAGAIHRVAPFRVYDSRFGDGELAAGTSRVVSVADSIDVDTGAVITADAVPAGATGIGYNLTIADTTSAGFLSVAPGDATVLGASSINWATGGVFVANGSETSLDDDRKIKVFSAGAPDAATDFIVDVTSYTR